jgi:16S rRNA (guanine527-N7)-methyltransferase
MRPEPAFAELLAPYASGRGLERLIRFAELLERWSARHNLVRFASREELVRRHIVDALAATPVVDSSTSLLDVGSGAGLPGVPLLAVSPGCHGTLLEPRQKRWAFLKLVVRELDLNAEAERRRYESIEPGRRWGLVLARAVGRDEALLEWAVERLLPGGEVVLWTTEDGENRLAKSTSWRMLSSALPGLERGRLCRLQPCFT